jgi:hypothetical protein
MNVLEMQIMFQTKCEAINADFFDKIRPDSYDIVNYLNKSIDRYVRDKFLNLPTHSLRRASILSNMDALKDMVENTIALTEDSITGFPHGAATLRVLLPADMLSLISVYCTYTRTDVPPMSSDILFTEFVSVEETKDIVTTGANKPIFPYPVAAYENEFNILLIGDAYTTEFSNVKIRYLREPFDLSLSYAELEATADGTDLTSINTIVADNNYFRAFAKGDYYDDVPQSITFQAGDKVKKVSGYNTIVGTPYTSWKQKIGAPYGETDTPELPGHLHEEVVDLAVQMFMDEARLKLIPKAQSA